MTNENSSRPTPVKRSQAGSNESGAALATAILMMALLSAIAMTVLAVVRTESRIAGSDLKRTQTFYAAAAGIEKMTADFSTLWSKTTHPTLGQYANIANAPPVGLAADGYTLVQTLGQDTATLNSMRITQGISAPAFPSAVLGTDSPFAGLNASVNPFTLTTTATGNDGTQVALTRQMNNYLIPIFQFGVFSDQDLEFWPYPPMTFNGRVHANGNIYFGGDITFLARVTTANEAVRDKLRNNGPNNTLVGGVYYSDPRWKLTPGGPDVHMTQGSVNGGPYMQATQPRADGRGAFPTSPVGTDNTNWSNYSLIPFGGLLLSKSTGVLPLKLPLQLSELNKQPLELIKRTMPDDLLPGFDALNESRYVNKAQIRVLIDDEAAGSGAANAAGIPAGKGVYLSQFVPSELDGGNALRVVTDAGAYAAGLDWNQGANVRGKPAKTVRGVRNDYANLIVATTPSAGNSGGFNALSNTDFNANKNNSALDPFRASNDAIIPTGSGIKGRILIEVQPAPLPDGTMPAAIDVTQQVLSMGVTVGEPNAILNLQRPEWAAFMQGGRERKGTNYYLNYFMDSTVTNRRALADGEINQAVAFNSAGFLSGTDANLDDETLHVLNQFQPDVPTRDDKVATIVVNGNSAINATSVTVWPLAMPLANGTVLDFGGGKTARLTAAAAVGAVTLTVANLAAALVPGDFEHGFYAQYGLNKIVPINLYNVREGHIDEAALTTAVYQRGITSIIDINMRNLARWVDGVYDGNLLNGTPAVSTNIYGADGYVVYISDRRGDRVKGERNFAGSTIQTTNGTVDNEDVYGYNQADGAIPTPGEDVIDDGIDPNTGLAKKGSLQVDKCELPSPAAIVTTAVNRSIGAAAAGVSQSNYDAAAWVTDWNINAPVTLCTAATAAANQYWFRRAVRVFNGEKLQITGAAGKLSTTKGITIASENMAYIWGNYNTNGINVAPAAGISSLNDPAVTSHFMPTATDTQVPSSIVADAFFPLSKTWYDTLPAMYPEGSNTRIADAGNTNDTDAIAITAETSVRAGVISGSTLSNMITGVIPSGAAYLDNLNGGVHNFPRFLETWTYGAREERWNYTGSFIMLFNSTQAVGPWSVLGNYVYAPPWRNWGFDVTFTDPNRLPPGTPQFQHVEPTGFRQIL